MHRRILIGTAAWLLGAVTATTGSVLVVSLLGQGITGSSGQMLTQDMVNRELASEAVEASLSASPAVTASPTPTPTPAAVSSPPIASAPATTPPPVKTSSPVIVPSPPPTFASPTATPVTAPTVPYTSGTGTVLTSQGGEVVASCQAAGAYLISWSPQQGYEADDVFRGPAATARATFASSTVRVIMTVRCSAGVPSATSTTQPGDE